MIATRLQATKTRRCGDTFPPSLRASVAGGGARFIALRLALFRARFPPAFPHRLVVLALAVAAATAFFPAAVNGVDRGPGTALGFLLGNAAFAVTLLDVL